MTRVIPAAGRAIRIDDPDGVEYVIPAQRNFGAIGFISAWCVGWAVGEFFVTRQLIVGKAPPSATLFMAAWLTTWTLGGVFAVSTVLWSLAGRERIRRTPESLILTSELFGYQRKREFDWAEVKDLGVRPQVLYRHQAPLANGLLGTGSGPIAFDYGARTYRFAAGIEEAEAKAMVDALMRPEPARKW